MTSSLTAQTFESSSFGWNGSKGTAFASQLGVDPFGTQILGSVYRSGKRLGLGFTVVSAKTGVSIDFVMADYEYGQHREDIRGWRFISVDPSTVTEQHIGTTGCTITIFND